MWRSPVEIVDSSLWATFAEAPNAPGTLKTISSEATANR
jgi:hypothetical protein